MAGRDVLLERVVNGARNVLTETRVPANLVMAVEEAEDHVHIVLGTTEELAGIGLKETVFSKPRKRKAPVRDVSKRIHYLDPSAAPLTGRKSTAKK